MIRGVYKGGSGAFCGGTKLYRFYQALGFGPKLTYVGPTEWVLGNLGGPWGLGVRP